MVVLIALMWSLHCVFDVLWFVDKLNNCLLVLRQLCWQLSRNSCFILVLPWWPSCDISTTLNWIVFGTIFCFLMISPLWLTLILSLISSKIFISFDFSYDSLFIIRITFCSVLSFFVSFIISSLETCHMQDSEQFCRVSCEIIGWVVVSLTMFDDEVVLSQSEIPTFKS